MKLLFKRFAFYTVLLFCSWSSSAQTESVKSKPILFIENKGQVYDQDFQPNINVVYSGSFGGTNFHLRTNGISYQFQRIDTWKEGPIKAKYPRKGQEILNRLPDQTTIYRLDFEWLNTNTVVPSGKNASGGLTNYYFAHCAEGITGVKSFEDVYYKNIYMHIDLHYYSVKGRLKYDYIVAPFANHHLIRFSVKGATSIRIEDDGSLLIKTPLGNLREEKPLVLQEGKALESSWVLKDTVLSFEVKNRDLSKAMIIDPAVRAWATFYGTAYFDMNEACVSDSIGSIFMSGSSRGQGLATLGAHQTTISAIQSAFLVNFDVSGNRQWCTYYGNYGFTTGSSCALDISGSVYLAGNTSCSAAIGTPGTHQPSIGTGVSEGYVAKFTAAGIRTWGTYFGGTAGDFIKHVSVSQQGDVFFSGQTTSPTSTLVATPGAFQTTASGNVDGFIGMFNSSGQRQWSSFFASSADDDIIGNVIDRYGNVYFVGDIGASTGTTIASAGSYQPNYGGGPLDGFLAKFTNTGQRIFCTYYGGTGMDHGIDCAVDNAGNILYTGQAFGSQFATSGAYLSTGRNVNAKFSPTGQRIWGSFFGPATGGDSPTAMVADRYGNFFLAGYATTATSTLIATSGNYQSVFNGGPQDGFFMKFDGNGYYVWGTYYGSSDYESATDVAVDTLGHVYGSGVSLASNGNSFLATPNSFQTVTAGNGDGILVQFYDCSVFPVITTPSTALSICEGMTTTITARCNGAVSWFDSALSTTAIASGPLLYTPTLTAGTYSFYVEVNFCAATRTMVTVLVRPNPSITVNSASICPGQVFTINPQGAVTYTYSTL